MWPIVSSFVASIKTSGDFVLKVGRCQGVVVLVALSLAALVVTSDQALSEDAQSAAAEKVEGGNEAGEKKGEAKEGAQEEGGAAKTDNGPTIHRKVKAPQVQVEDPRGSVDLVVCSQNLKMFGTLEAMKQKVANYSPRERDIKIDELVDRFAAAGCDIIAVQEVLGRTTEIAEAALNDLAQNLQRRTNRFYEVRVGPGAEGGLALGFLAAKDRVNIVSTLSYARVELPKISPKEKPRLFSRTPLELQATVYSREGNVPKTVTLVNFHFKSKRGGAADPTGLEWETYRMEMAEALRRIVELRHKNSFASGETILMLLGDRNSNFDVASARILEGSISLANFRANGGCRLTKRGLPICRADTSLPKRLFSVLTTSRSVLSLPGTFEYKGEYSWLDDILMPAESLVYVWKSAYSDAKYSSGVLYKPKEASDHAMVYTKLNW
jgi:hypothetical protein